MNDMTVFVEQNSLLARICARMPVEVQMSFTPEQIAALGVATYYPPSPHKVAIRKTFGIFGKRYYLALFMGRDRRVPGGNHAAPDEFRADWRYVLSGLVAVCLIASLIVFGLTYAWSYAAVAVGGPYRTMGLPEFRHLPFF
jgi:hypothetical protein